MKKLLVTLLSCLTLVNSYGYTNDYYGCTGNDKEQAKFEKENLLFGVDYEIASHIQAMIRNINELYLDNSEIKIFKQYKYNLKDIARTLENVAIILLRNGCYAIGVNEMLNDIKNKVNEMQEKFFYNARAFNACYPLLRYCDELIEANSVLLKYEEGKKMGTYRYGNFLIQLQDEYNQLKKRQKDSIELSYSIRNM